MKLLMQPLASIHVRTEALMLTKVEVWWYLVVQLGPNLSSNFDQVRCFVAQQSLHLCICTTCRLQQLLIPGRCEADIPTFSF